MKYAVVSAAVVAALALPIAVSAAPKVAPKAALKIEPAAKRVVTVYCDVTFEETKLDRPKKDNDLVETAQLARQITQVYSINYDTSELYPVSGPFMTGTKVIKITRVSADELTIQNYRDKLDMSPSWPDVWNVEFNRQSGRLYITRDHTMRITYDRYANQYGGIGEKAVYSGQCAPGKLVPFPEARF